MDVDCFVKRNGHSRFPRAAQPLGTTLDNGVEMLLLVAVGVSLSNSMRLAAVGVPFLKGQTSMLLAAGGVQPLQWYL